LLVQTPLRRDHKLELEGALNHRSSHEYCPGSGTFGARTEAYRQAWWDGPPYAYHFGLTNAHRHLRELDAPEPQLPPFDASKYAPMPEVELDPDDEFHVGKTAEA
jgi:hypothetical protein